jgi:uncharacterized protein (TIRG00374 family)
MEKSRLVPLLGIIIFVAVLMNTDLLLIIDTLLAARIDLILFVILLHVPVILLKAWKWKILTHAYGNSPGIFRFVYSWLVGFVIGMVTPGRLGEISKVYYLKDNFSFGKGIATVAVDRIIDIIVLFILAILGIITFLYGRVLQNEIVYMLIILFSAFLFSVYFVFSRSGSVKKYSKPIFKRLVPKRMKSGMKAAFHEFYQGLNEIKKRKGIVIASFSLTVISWFLAIFQFELIAISLSLQIDYFFLLSVMPIITLLDALPISFSGLGTREVALIFIFGLIGISIESTISFSIMVFMLGYMVYVPLALIIWFHKPIKIKL